jgi:hypothetical protein
MKTLLIVTALAIAQGEAVEQEGDDGWAHLDHLKGKLQQPQQAQKAQQPRPDRAARDQEREQRLEAVRTARQQQAQYRAWRRKASLAQKRSSGWYDRRRNVINVLIYRQQAYHRARVRRFVYGW